MMFSTQVKAEPRDREVVRNDLREKISQDYHPEIWKLIYELEDGAWRGGFDEGYQHGCFEGREQLEGQQ